MATKPRKDVVPSQGGQPAQTPEMIQALLTEAKAKKLELLEQAKRYHDAHQLERFVPHEKQRQDSWQYTEADGTVLGQQITPLDRVGIYVPGG